MILITIQIIVIECSYNDYLSEYKTKYSSSTENVDKHEILSVLYAQSKISEKLEKNMAKIFIPLFFICSVLRPLGKISMALLLEFSTNELEVLTAFRQYTYVTTGLAPFLAYIVLVIVNDFTVTIIIISIICLIYFICSLFFIHEIIEFEAYKIEEYKKNDR